MNAEPGREIIVTAALTGPIAAKADHPDLPVTPEEIASAAAGFAEAGAAIVHVHLRDEHGRPTADIQVGLGRWSDRRALRCARATLDRGWIGRAVRGAGCARRAAAADGVVERVLDDFGSGEFLNPPDQSGGSPIGWASWGSSPSSRSTTPVTSRSRSSWRAKGCWRRRAVLDRDGRARRDGGLAGELVRVVAGLPDNAVWQIVAVGRAHLSLLRSQSRWAAMPGRVSRTRY